MAGHVPAVSLHYTEISALFPLRKDITPRKKLTVDEALEQQEEEISSRTNSTRAETSVETVRLVEGIYTYSLNTDEFIKSSGSGHTDSG